MLDWSLVGGGLFALSLTWSSRLWQIDIPSFVWSGSVLLGHERVM